MPYALGHLEEKLNRVKAITANGGSAVKNEHIEDSVIDLANYAVMLYVELKNKENGKLYGLGEMYNDRWHYCNSNSFGDSTTLPNKTDTVKRAAYWGLHLVSLPYLFGV